MNALLYVFIIILCSSFSYALTDDELLCGVRQDSAFEQIKLNRIQQRMPLVRDQAPADWCAVFSAEPMISYFNLLSYEKNGFTGTPEQFYAGKGRPSLIDLRAQATNFLEEKDSVDFTDGQVFASILYAFQKNQFRIRSEKSLEFLSTKEKNQQVAELAEKILKKYADPKAPDTYIFEFGQKEIEVQMSGDKVDQAGVEVREAIASFEFVSPQLYEAARRSGSLKSNSEVSPYQAAVKNIESDYQSYPFSVKGFMTSNMNSYFKKVKEVLAGGYGVPLQAPVCGSDLDGSGTCYPHSVLIVGHGWVGDQCMIKVRNSWGRNWPNKKGDGTQNLTVEQWKNMLNHIRGKEGLGLSLTWLSEYNAKEIPNLFEADYVPIYRNSENEDNKNYDFFSGFLINSAKSLKPWTGRRFNLGYEATYENGEITQSKNFPFNDGTSYSGTFYQKRYFDGILTYPSGETLRYVQGKPYQGKLFLTESKDSYVFVQQGIKVRAYNLKLSDGSLFTGELKTAGEGIVQPWNGTVTTAQGKKVISKGYYVN